MHPLLDICQRPSLPGSPHEPAPFILRLSFSPSFPSFHVSLHPTSMSCSLSLSLSLSLPLSVILLLMCHPLLRSVQYCISQMPSTTGMTLWGNPNSRANCLDPWIKTMNEVSETQPVPWWLDINFFHTGSQETENRADRFGFRDDQFSGRLVCHSSHA